MRFFRKLSRILAVGASAFILTQGCAICASAAPVTTTSTTQTAWGATTSSTRATTTTTARAATAATTTTSTGRPNPVPGTRQATTSATPGYVTYEDDTLTFLDDTEPMKKYYDEIAKRTDVYDEETDIGAFFREAQYKFHDAFGTALTDQIGKGIMITILIVLILLSLFWGCTGHKTYPFFSALLIFLLLNGLSLAELICSATGADTKFFSAVPIWINTILFLLSAGLIFFCFKQRRFSAFIMMMTCTLPLTLLGGWFILRDRYVNAFAVWFGYRKTLLSGADPEYAGMTLTVLNIVLFAFAIGIAAIFSLLGAKFKKPFLMAASALSCGMFSGYLLASMITKTSKLSILSYLAMGLLALGGFLMQLYIGHGFLERKKKPAPSPVLGYQPEPEPDDEPDIRTDGYPAPFAGPETYPQPDSFVQPPAPAPLPVPTVKAPEPAPVPNPSPAPIPAPAVPRAAFCTNCGAKLDPDAAFCTSCGAKAGSSAAGKAAPAPKDPQPASAKQESGSLHGVFSDPFSGKAEKPAEPEPASEKPVSEPRNVLNQESRKKREMQSHNKEKTGGPVIHMGDKKPEKEGGLVLNLGKKEQEQKTSTGDDVFDQDDF